MKKFLFLVAFAALITSCARIDSASEALKVDQYGNDKGTPIAVEVKGWVFYNPWTQDVYEYPLNMQHAEYDEISFGAKGGSIFKAKPTFNYRMHPGRAVSVFSVYRKDMDYIQEKFMYGIVQQVYIRVGNSFTPDSLLSSMSVFEQRLIEELKKEMGADFEIDRLVSNLTPPDGLVEAINDKNKMDQDAAKKWKEVDKAEAEAARKKAEADGNASAIRIQADAEAYANSKKQSTLTPLLIQQQYIEKWDGKLPVYGQVPTLFKPAQ